MLRIKSLVTHLQNKFTTMKKVLSLLVFACSSQFISAQSITDTTILPNKIIGGTAALISNHPWQAFISTNVSFCSGAIIGSSYILTAAHCLFYLDEPIPASEFHVKIGTAQPFEDDQGTVYQVAETFAHPSYDPSTGLHDIAILKLESPIEFNVVDVIEPAAVADGISVGTTTNVAGWGWTSFVSGQESDILLEINIPIVEIYQYQIVAGYSNGSQAVCFGDSGSPLVADIGDTEKLTGITSSNASSECDSYGIFTRVSQYETWIYSCIENFNPVGDTTVCESDTSSNFICNNLAGYSYQWQLSSPEAGTLITDRYTCRIDWDPDFKGTVILSVRAGKGGAYSGWYSLPINRLPATHFITFPEGMRLEEHADTTLLARAEGHNVTYQWMKDNLAIDGETDSTLTLSDVNSSNEGIYKVLAYGTCSSAESDTFHIQVYTAVTSISENTPIIGRLMNMEVSPPETLTVSIYNLNGILIYQKLHVTSEQYIDLSSLKQGVYIMQILSNAGQIKAMKFMCY